MLAAAVAFVAIACGPGHHGGATATRPPPSATRAIDDKLYVSIGGIEQWITIAGDDRDNPVILFVHGGPGSPLSPYSDSIYGAWRKDFTLANWDQRGAGKTYQRSGEPDLATMTIERFAADGLEVVDYLRQRLDKKQIILIGTSWGAAVAVHMVKARPGVFAAYIGASPLVNARAGATASYQRVLALARAASDTASITALEALGPPPFDHVRKFGQLRRLMRKYEAQRATPAPSSWAIAPAYAGDEERAAHAAGDDFSFLHFFGLRGDGLFTTIDLSALGPTFGIPVYVVQGTEDLMTVPEIAKAFFETIEAPAKKFVLLPATGHGTNRAMVDAQYRLLMEDVRPLMR